MATFFRGAFRQTSQTAPRSALSGARQNIRRKADRMEDHQLQELETRVRVGRGRWGSGERTWGWSGGGPEVMVVLSARGIRTTGKLAEHQDHQQHLISVLISF